MKLFIPSDSPPWLPEFADWLGRTFRTVLDAINASDVVNVPSGSVASTNVQAAINELDSEKQPKDDGLTSLAALAANGIVCEIGTDTFTARTLTGAAAGISVTNGNGVAGNPTIALANDLAAIEALSGTSTIYYRSGVDTWSAVTINTNLGFSGGTLGSSLGTAATLASDTDGTLAANSDTRIATQKATKTYVDTAVTGVMKFKGVTDCSANPNYPAAAKGDAYIVTVAGKIGGASGKSVDIGDVYLASAANAGGTEASVGTSWNVLEHNLVGALLSANNLSDIASASTARTNLGLGTAATQSTGTSGATIPVLNAANTWGSAQTFLNSSGIKIQDTDASHTLGIIVGSNLTATRTLTLTTGDASRVLDISATDVTVTTAGAALIDDASAAAQRTTLGLDSAPTFTAVSFATGWTNLSAFTPAWQSCQYAKTIDGKINIRGYAYNPGGTGTSTIFTLPSGFRPTNQILLGSVQITSAGVVTTNSFTGGIDNYCWLEGSFYP